MNTVVKEILKAIVYIAATVLGLSVTEGCSIIGHADNVYKTPCIEKGN